MSTNMRGLLCEGVMIWIPLDFQMSTNMRGLLCEGVDDMGTMDLSH